jgi:hypothetical protein
VPVLKAVLGLYVNDSHKWAATRFENGTQPVLAAIFNLFENYQYLISAVFKCDPRKGRAV